MRCLLGKMVAHPLELPWRASASINNFNTLKVNPCTALAREQGATVQCYDEVDSFA